ncbi:hypothetical protein B0T20DRAFT_26753 [Sordaria brevicollis]|uniref:Developmental regulatory protein wetA n=1 Tax=Sordaria brevicollis TaxID=83679 RepID=A0AAE0PPC9_SORBR|nr:hypothetical protein B0T20DRAFT_26753 [Sordaria brevicollis]
MVTVQGMSFAVGDLPLGENKGGDSAFCWQDSATDDAGSADFFDQFVVLDDHGPDHSPSPPFTGEEGVGGGTEGGGDESFERMCREALESSLSPPLTSLSCPPLDHHSSVSGIGDHENRASVAATSGRLGRFSSAKFPPQHRQVRAGSHVDLSNMDCQYSQQQHQLLIAGQRELNSILGTGYQEGPGSGGSISDSELLRLEGLTVNGGSGSPRIHLPPSSASVPPSPHLQPGSASTSPRKSRLEAFYTKIRNKAANLHGNNKQKQQLPITTTAPAVTSAMPSTTMGTSPNKMTARPRPHNLSLVRPEMPLSPPLTGQMTAEQNSNNDAHMFNTSFMDDPFMDISSNLSLQMQHTPIQTPHQQHQTIPQLPVTTTAGGENSWQFSVSGPPPTTPAAQIVDGLPSSAAELHPLYASALDNGNNWWDQAVGDAMDTDPDPSSSFQLGTSAANTREATLNLQMALQQLQEQGNFDDHFGLGDTSGLVLHMPQPTSRVQLHQNQQQMNQAEAHAQAQAHAAAQLLLAQQQYLPDGCLPSQPSSSTTTSTGTTTARSRRPKPRAPSSGASRLPSYQTSPRKVQAVSRSSRESSPTRSSQQSLAVPDSSSGSGRQRLHRRSASMQNINHLSSSTSTPGLGLGLMSPAAVRKRKSFTGRGHGSSMSLSAGSRLSHAASHGDLGASASAFAKAIGASGHRVVPENHFPNGSGNGGRLKSSSSTPSLAGPSSSGSGRFTPLNGLPMNGSFHPAMVGGYPPMPPLPSHLQSPSSSLPEQHHALPHHPHHSSQPIPMRSSSRQSPTKPSKSRSTSHSKTPSQSHSSSSGTSSGGGIGFVNFTPLDHHTLMSGVAPSGSSKTKARREREAAEQRRKLSEDLTWKRRE